MRVIFTILILFILTGATNILKINSTHKYINSIIDSNANTLIIGSSRTHHNLHIDYLPDSINVISKPNLYAIDQYNIIKSINFDDNNIRYLLLELQEENISSSLNTRYFWDVRSIQDVLKFTSHKKIALINCLITLDPLLYITPAKKVFHSQRLISSQSELYSKMVNRTTDDVKKNILAYTKDSLIYNTKSNIYGHDLVNIDLYKQLRDEIPQNIDLIFYSPFGRYHSNRSISDDFKVIELRNINLTIHDIHDYNHLKENGAIKMTKTFLEALENF